MFVSFSSFGNGIHERHLRGRVNIDRRCGNGTIVWRSDERPKRGIGGFSSFEAMMDRNGCS